MDQLARDIVGIGNKAFSDKQQVDALHQEIALNFYPERADFTSIRSEGEEYADHLFSSYPVLARRELGNMLDEFLFPEKWFSIHVDDEDLDAGDDERAFLEKLSEIQWRVMNDPIANLTVARGDTNHDFATFGNGVLRFSKNFAGDALLFRNYHLRDCAFSENGEGRVDLLHRNLEPTARQLMGMFRDKVSENVRKAMGEGGAQGRDPEKTFTCRHVILPSRVYRYKSKGGKEFPFVSLYVECESETVLEEVGIGRFEYVVPRWQTVGRSGYGTSMVTSVLLPDGRTLQVMMRTLREAGEAYVNPPMVAFTDAIRGDIALAPGGVTISDIEYDGKLADVLRPITKDRSGFPIGVELAAALKEDIRNGSFLDKIQLPEIQKAMTATEVRRRIQEHIRAAGPISKPIQPRYQNPLCEGVFDLLKAEGVFPMQWMPKSLSDKEIKFKFRSPLDELAEQNEAELMLDSRDRILIPAMQVDPSLAEVVDLHQATRDALRANGWKAKWFKPKEAYQEAKAKQMQEMMAQKAAAQIGGMGAVAEQGGKGLNELIAAAQNAGLAPTPDQMAEEGYAPGQGGAGGIDPQMLAQLLGGQAPGQGQGQGLEPSYDEPEPMPGQTPIVPPSPPPQMPMPPPPGAMPPPRGGRPGARAPVRAAGGRR